MTYHIRVKAVTGFIFLLAAMNVLSQKVFYGESPVKWENYSETKVPSDLEKHKGSDLVILNDETSFSFFESGNEKITRNITYKINTGNGLTKVGAYKLPESLDPAFDENYYRQGRQTRIKAPFIQEFTIQKFSARKFWRGKWVPVTFDLRYEKIRWIRPSGDDVGGFMDEDLSVFNFQSLNIGDIIQIVYEATFDSDYGNNLFYLHGPYPKLSCQYTFMHKFDRILKDFSFTFAANVPDSAITRDKITTNNYAIVTEKINLYNLKAINYPANCLEGNSLPHMFADFRVYRILTGSFPTGGGRVYDMAYFRPKNFEWVIYADTNNYYAKSYDKQFLALHKFMAKMPAITGSDSSHVVFFKALTDTLNNFRFISSNHMYYNEQNLKDVYSGDHLLKRRLVEHSQWKLYRDILQDNKIFYNVVNVQDRRYGEHSPKYRASYAYEKQLIAIPYKKSYVFFMPRYDGVKYHLDELPFYLEGSLALLSPRNFQEKTKEKEDKFFNFIRTPRGTFNENTRAENASVRISLDSLKADLSIKEALSGQFSTVLRHVYLNELIDSTIALHYFKKCTDKPLASNSKIKLSSKTSDFPFRYNFNCSEQVKLTSDKHISFNNWFSFILSKKTFPEAPNHDYYFDFDFSDTYNYLLMFTSSVTLTNAAAFERKISNEYFVLESSITSNSETSYLLRVKLTVRQRSIPEEKMGLLMELVNELDSLNDFSLELVRK